MKKLAAAIVLGLAFLAQAEELKTALARHQQSYEQELAKTESNSRQAFKALADEYLQYLNILEQKSQQAGDLDNVLTVRKEKERFTELKDLSEDAIVKEPAGLADLQRMTIKAMQAAELKKSKDVMSAASKYLASLQELKKNLTKQSKVDEAVLVKAEIERVKQRAEIAGAQAVLAATGADTASQEAAKGPAPKDIAPSGTNEAPAWLKQDLVLHYPFDRGEARQVSDKSGKKHTGQVHGAKWTAAGRIGGAYSFNGKGNYLEVDDSPDFNDPEQFTIALWVKPDDLTPSVIPISKDADGGYYIQWYAPHAALGFGVATTFCESAGGPNQLKVGEWQHLALVFDGRTAALYRNGGLLGSPVAAHAPPNMRFPLFIGAYGLKSPKSYFFKGLIDEVRIYRRALSQAELTELYHLTTQ